MASDEWLSRRLKTFLVFSDGENERGKWMPFHPWKSDKPNPKLEMKDTVANSTSYPVSRYWKRKLDVDLAKIYSNLPSFVEDEMKGSINGSRQELEQLVYKNYWDNIPSLENFSPHVREIVDEIEDSGKRDQKSLPSDDETFEARSMRRTWFGSQDERNYFHFDCEFMLRMYVPDFLLPWFDIQRFETTQWIRKIKKKSKDKRWIFTPSFRRAKIALLDWPEDDIVTRESTIRILVVRPSEFEEYVKYCGNNFPVICLPQDEIGAGYARYWIQKIALRLKLQFIWMIDDSVECFYEYHPTKQPPERKDGTRNYSDYRRRKFGLVFKRIEHFVEDADDSDNPIAAMSPRRWNPLCQPKKPFVCKPPQGAVYLNLRALLEENVYYRPELKFLEDMIFGYECEKKGLKVFMDNRIHLQDHKWKDTGARSPSVKGY